ncbi:MAG: hypothetical protein ACTSVY_13215, partial [Candidatus Helarchaeota archaeon]
MPSDSKEIKIKIEAIETPAGMVPNVDSIKKIAEALNIINTEIIENHDEIKKEVINKMEGFEKEIKVFRKIFAEKIITNESILIKLKSLEDKIEKLNDKLNKFEQNLKIIIAD